MGKKAKKSAAKPESSDWNQNKIQQQNFRVIEACGSTLEKNIFSGK